MGDLQVKADEYVITVYLRTGLLAVEGQLAYQWFKVVFPKIMDQYDRSTSARPSDYFQTQVALDVRKELQKQKSKLKIS